jgi:FMN-dependent oxidoreductase (nitrilotriacetate monooxygenase family)
VVCNLLKEPSGRNPKQGKMAADRRQLKLCMIVAPTAAHVGGWRHPAAISDVEATFEDWRNWAQAAERARFDAIFLADTLALPDSTPDVLSRDLAVSRYEPLTLLSAIAVHTDRLGLVSTATTSYNEPYHIARKFASLDHLSKGRAGWNLVTSYFEIESKNFGREQHYAHFDRYERALEFYQVVAKLWDSWEDDAFVVDKITGIYFDEKKFLPPLHKGKYFSVSGALNVSRPPQGHPVLLQAGSSQEGRDLAARTADVVFTAQQTLEGAREFYSDIKARVVKFGRSPDAVKILPGILTVPGSSQSEAQAKYDLLQSLVHPTIGLSRLSTIAGGFDFSRFPLDGPVPRDIPTTNASQSRQKLILDSAYRDGLTIREFYLRVVSSYGHRVLIGTGTSIADDMELWFQEGVADGFVIIPTFLPAAIDDFAALVIPELQRRLLFRTEYEGCTLRENLGLPRRMFPPVEPA